MIETLRELPQHEARIARFRPDFARPPFGRNPPGRSGSGFGFARRVIFAIGNFSTAAAQYEVASAVVVCSIQSPRRSANRKRNLPNSAFVRSRFADPFCWRDSAAATPRTEPAPPR
ncbi:hypothetical protein GCM10020255_028730 [Rhodococcus baikonurensis]